MNEKLHNECRSVKNAIEGGVNMFLELVLLIFFLLNSKNCFDKRSHRYEKKLKLHQVYQLNRVQM